MNLGEKLLNLRKTKNLTQDDGILGFAKVFEDPKDGDGVALGVVTVDEMYEKFIGR